ncbi:MAG TPA: aminoglycoside phosphotransferase family protein [Acidimicrobiales bacterium]|nr:aminoglycoside phosphotransferase family protein [Acidimicrobiales bacterium]
MPHGPTGGRTVTLVVVEGDGVDGQLEPFEVSTPWWQDVEPIVATYPGLAVLRLLEATPMPGAVCGGQVTYLVERLPEELASRATEPWPIRPWHGSLHDDPLRAPWAMPGGPAADLAWACTQVERTGDPTQHRTWNLSAIWSIPTTEGDVWLKCVPSFFRHEAGILAWLDGHRVPRLIAARGHRELLESLPGEDGYDATLDQHRVLIDELVALQLATVATTNELLGLGVPDRRWASLVAAASDVVTRRLPRNAELGALLDTADARVAAIEACGLPDVLVHGDAHGGNARVGPGTGGGIWYDWGDARVGNPLLDVAVLERPRTLHRDALLAHWLEAWRAAVPGSDPHRAWPLIRPLAALGDAVVYQGFLDRIEASEQIYHRDDVVPCLLRAASAAGQP